MKRTSLLLFICLGLLSFAGCDKIIAPSSVSTESNNSASLSGKLTLSGSTSMTKLCNSLGEAFMQEYPEVVVEKSDTGSGSAVKSVLDGTALIGDLSRKLKPEENPDEFVSVTIALDGIAVILSDKNPVADLSSEQVMKIFTGEIQNWAEVGGDDIAITLIGREESSGTREGFESILGLEDRCQYEAEYPESGDIVSKVSNDAGAIGYCSLFSVSGDIKALSIDGVSPSEQTISAGHYKIQRPFVEIFKKGSDSELINAWFSFVGSEAGRNLILKENLVPVRINEPIGQ